MERGLELSPEKTVITHITGGFDFLGFNIRRYDNNKLIQKPAKSAFESIKEKVREIVLGHGKASSRETFIKELNPIIRGWYNYYRGVCSKKVFNALHDYPFHLLEHWAHRRHSRRIWIWYMRRYWLGYARCNGCSPSRSGDGMARPECWNYSPLET